MSDTPDLADLTADMIQAISDDALAEATRKAFDAGDREDMLAAILECERRGMVVE